MEKTISYLNSKIWYRLVKVAYIFSFLAACALTVFILFSFCYKTSEVIDNPNTKIICQTGNKKQFLIKDVFSNNDIPTTIPDYYVATDKFSKKISNFCITPLDPEKKSYTLEELQASSLEELQAVGAKPKDGFIPYPYRIEKKYIEVKEGATISVIYSLIGLIIMALIFETLKRVFYYVVLGTIKPKK
ncbi:MAG: hypothetical protein WC619_02975 [Patescibacteria group bacterium]